MSAFIDVHHHALPPGYVSSARDLGFAGPVKGQPFPQWTPEHSLAVMDDVGTDLAILSISVPGCAGAQGSQCGALASRTNDELAAIVDAGRGRFGAFCLVPVAAGPQAAVREIDRALDELGLDGVGLYTSYDDVYLGEPELDPVLAHLDERGAVGFVHPTPTKRSWPTFDLPASVLEFPIETTRAATSLLFSGTLDRRPGLKLILSHAGGAVPFVARRLLHAPTIDPSWQGRPPQDLMASLSRLYYDTAMSGTDVQLTALRDVASPGHILYGSDYPFMPAEHSRDNAAGVRGHDGFDADELHAVVRGNAATLFARAARPVTRSGATPPSAVGAARS